MLAPTYQIWSPRPPGTRDLCIPGFGNRKIQALFLSAKGVAHVPSNICIHGLKRQCCAALVQLQVCAFQTNIAPTINVYFAIDWQED